LHTPSDEPDEELVRAMARTRDVAVFRPEGLSAFAIAAFQAAGASSADASDAADVLVRTDLRGIHSHGVQTLPIHLDNLRDGGTSSPVAVTVIRETPVTAVVDGNGGIGLVVARRANEIAITKARASGVGIVLVRGSNHFGAAGYYALETAQAGFIGAATSNASPIMTAAGAKKKTISNAPFAYAIPTRGAPISLDIAMSATAGMKVRMAATAGQSIPLGWIVNADGEPTTDAADYGRGGSLLPVGGHKGSGLAVLTEALAGALSGAGMMSGIVPWLVETGTPTNAGHAFVALDIESFMDRAEFDDRIEQMTAELRGATPAPGVDAVLAPGDIEARNEQQALEHGLSLGSGVTDRLDIVADRFGLHDLLAAARRD
jgi:LDH2 family malate/lactate/ureidoglycolate dehydrogenase